MHCPVCHSHETKVIDSRVTSDGMSIRRRRECTKCAYRFSTIEETELLDIMVIKSDGHRESYSREKLKAGIQRSLVKRPYTQEKFYRLIQLIERDLQRKRKRELTSKEIGEVIMKHLKRFDKVAYVRFASVYRAFEDVKTFQSELKKLQQTKRKP